jgi:hypothetical protein
MLKTGSKSGRSDINGEAKLLLGVARASQPPVTSHRSLDVARIG